MINQILFLFGLYVFGVFFGLLFKRQLPIALIGITGFLWGALFWVVGGMGLLTASIPYTPASMLVYFVILGIGMLVFHVRYQTWRISSRELACLLATAFIFLLVVVLSSHFNLSTISQDSVVLISTGRNIAFRGFSQAVIKELTLRGGYLSLLQSASVFLGDGYLYASQPGFSITFFLANIFLSHRIIYHLVPDKRLTLTLSLMTSLTLFSTYFIVYQFFYINTNMISAVYLFVAASAFWLAMIEENNSWLLFGMLALLGFSLARNEAPLFSLVFLLLVISVGGVSYRVRLISILPFLIFLILWYSYLYYRMGEGTKILNPERTMIIIGSLFVLGLFVLLSEREWIKRLVLPHFPKIMLGALLLILLVMFILKPKPMIDSVYFSIMNMLAYGWWGITWLVFSIVFVISLAGLRVPFEELFFYGISCFFSLLLALSYFRNPYRLGWGDSANRMFTHILPIVVLYVLMKVAQGLSGSALEKRARIKPE